MPLGSFHNLLDLGHTLATKFSYKCQNECETHACRKAGVLPYCYKNYIFVRLSLLFQSKHPYIFRVFLASEMARWMVMVPAGFFQPASCCQRHPMTTVYRKQGVAIPNAIHCPMDGLKNSSQSMPISYYCLSYLIIHQDFSAQVALHCARKWVQIFESNVAWGIKRIEPCC